VKACPSLSCTGKEDKTHRDEEKREEREKKKRGKDRWSVPKAVAMNIEGKGGGPTPFGK